MKLQMPSLPFLYVFTFFSNMFVGMLGLGLPLFAIQLGAGNIALGALGTMASLVYIGLVPVSGWLADRVPKNLQAGAGAILYGVALCLLPLFTRLFWIYPLVAVAFLALALVWPGLESALCKFVSGKALAKSSGWYNVSWSSGATIGYLVAGLIYGRKPAGVFWVAGGLSILFGIFFALLFRAPSQEPAAQNEAEKGPVYLLYLSWLANGMVYFALNVLRNIFPKLAESLGFSSQSLGALLLCLSLAQCLLFIILNRTAVWHFKFWPLPAALLVAFAGLVIVVFTEKLWGFALGFLLIGAAGGVTYSASLYYAVSLESSIAGSRSGWHEFYLGLGGFAGPLIGGLLAHLLGPKSPYAVSAGLVVLVLAIQLIYHRWKSRKPAAG